MTASLGKPIRLGAHDVTLHSLHCSSTSLFVRFRIVGPDPGSWDPSDHVVIARPGEDEKLRWVDGTSGVVAPGLGFFVWRLSWPGGSSVRVIYVDHGVALDDEEVSVGPPSTQAAHAALVGLDAVLVDEDWLDGPAN